MVGAVPARPMAVQAVEGVVTVGRYAPVMVGGVELRENVEGALVVAETSQTPQNRALQPGLKALAELESTSLACDG